MTKSFRWALRRWWGLERADRLTCLEAVLTLGLVRLAVLVLPFRWLATLMGRQDPEGAAPPSSGGSVLGRGSGVRRENAPEDREVCGPEVVLVWRVVRWIRSGARHVPWRARCLERSVTASLMLRRRGVAVTVRLGVTRGSEGLAAHAWVHHGDRVILGGRIADRYRPVATFS